MDISSKLAALEQRLRMYVNAAASRLAYFSPFAVTSSDGKTDALEGRPVDDQGDAYQRDVRRVQHAGFRSRPLTTAQGVALSVENSNTRLVCVAEDDGASVALDEGEAKVYSPAKPECRVWFDKDGVLHIDAASVKDVIVNGGTAKVSRVGDRTSGHAHTATFTLSAGVVPVTGTITIASNTDTLAEGADHFKA